MSSRPSWSLQRVLEKPKQTNKQKNLKLETHRALFQLQFENFVGGFLRTKWKGRPPLNHHSHVKQQRVKKTTFTK